MTARRFLQTVSLLAGLAISAALSERAWIGYSDAPTPTSAYDATTTDVATASAGTAPRVGTATEWANYRIGSGADPDTAQSVSSDERATGAPDRSEALPGDLWRQWLGLIDQSAYQQIPIINALLADSLRNRHDPGIYAEIADRLGRSDISVKVKALLLDLLHEIATPEAVAVLLDQARSTDQSPLYVPTLRALGRIGENRWDGRYHEELSPLLEGAWSQTGFARPSTIRALARAMAGVGAPGGVAALLGTLSAADSDSDTAERVREKRVAAFAELPKVSNPRAVPALKQALRTARVAGGKATKTAAARERSALAANPVQNGATNETAGFAPSASPVSAPHPPSAQNPRPDGEDADVALGEAPQSDAPNAIVGPVLQALENIATQEAQATLESFLSEEPQAAVHLRQNRASVSTFAAEHRRSSRSEASRNATQGADP